MKPWPADGPIFNMYPSTLSSWVRKARKKAGLARIRLHDFRHRWATNLAQNAQDDSAVMQAGGWSSRAAFAKYQHPTKQRRDVTLKQTPRLPPILPPNTGGRKGSESGAPS
jgi:integrase